MWHLINKKMFTSNAKRLDGSSSSMDFVDGSADAAAAAPVMLSTVGNDVVEIYH